MLPGTASRMLLMVFMLLGVAVTAAPAVHAATFVIDNINVAGVGFNDTTPAAPVGSNPGTTIGAQRLNVFQQAANVWGARLNSNVTIRVAAQFTPLTCTATSAVLGSAGPATVFRDFAGAPVAATWYHVALANARNNADLDPAADDLNANFSSTIGTPGCLTSSGWYYGFDSNPGAGLIDLMTVLIHELGHGLGFSTFVTLGTGAKLNGFNDGFMLNLENHGASPADYPSMTDAQRVAASTSTGNLHWVGPNVQAASGVLTAGRFGTHVQMFAPNPQQPGSSVSHWDTAATPNQIMEPSYTGALHTPVLELPLFQDIGWTLAGSGGTASLVAAVLPYARSVQVGSPATAFATVINTSQTTTATSCSIALPGGLGLPGPFQYQTASPSNTLTGTVNTPANIAAGAAQQFVFGFTPTTAFPATDIGLVFSCANAPAVVSFRGLNTFLLSSSSTPVPDVVAIGATPSNDGIVNIPTSGGQGFFASAAVNIGAGGAITTTVDDGGRGLALSLTLCQSNATGACINPATAGSSTTTTLATNQIATYTIFVQGTGNVPFDPANNRLFLRHKDAGGVTRGATNVAVRTFPGPTAPGQTAATNPSP